MGGNSYAYTIREDGGGGGGGGIVEYATLFLTRIQKQLLEMYFDKANISIVPLIQFPFYS